MPPAPWAKHGLSRHPLYALSRAAGVRILPEPGRGPALA
jgi:hypothetical protein